MKNGKFIKDIKALNVENGGLGPIIGEKIADLENYVYHYTFLGSIYTSIQNVLQSRKDDLSFDPSVEKSLGFMQASYSKACVIAGKKFSESAGKNKKRQKMDYRQSVSSISEMIEASYKAHPEKLKQRRKESERFNTLVLERYAAQQQGTAHFFGNTHLDHVAPYLKEETAARVKQEDIALNVELKFEQGRWTLFGELPEQYQEVLGQSIEVLNFVLDQKENAFIQRIKEQENLTVTMYVSKPKHNPLGTGQFWEFDKGHVEFNLAHYALQTPQLFAMVTMVELYRAVFGEPNDQFEEINGQWELSQQSNFLSSQRYARISELIDLDELSQELKGLEKNGFLRKAINGKSAKLSDLFLNLQQIKTYQERVEFLETSQTKLLHTSA